MNTEMTIGMERKFYNTLVHGALRRFVNKEAYAFGDYIQARFERTAKRRKKKALEIKELRQSECLKAPS